MKGQSVHLFSIETSKCLGEASAVECFNDVKLLTEPLYSMNTGASVDLHFRINHLLPPQQ